MTDASEDVVAISIVIPTFNRAELLKDVLASVAASNVVDPSLIEVVVADNNSSDDTAGTIARIEANGFPFALRRVVETRSGSSAARNRGIEAARGTYLVFMDDDQVIEKNYLGRVQGVFEATGAAVVGGPVHYYNADDIPDWSRPLIANIGQFDAGDETRALTPDERMLGGGNMTIRRDVLATVGTFDESLGRRDGSLVANEDREIQERIHAAGHTIMYSPDLLQYHFLRPERLTKGYWRKNRFDWGRTVYRHNRLSQSDGADKQLLGAPRWFWRSLATHEVPGYLRSLFSKDPAARFNRELDIFVKCGQIAEARASRRRPD